MKYREVICNAVLQKDLEQGLTKVAGPVKIRTGGDVPVETYLNAVREHVLDYCARVAVKRFLNRHGVRHTEQKDKLIIGGELCRIVARHLKNADTGLTEKAFQNLQAVLPAGFDRRERVRCVFVFLTGRVSLLVRGTVPDLLLPSGEISTADIKINTDGARAYLTATAGLPEELSLFEYCEESLRFACDVSSLVAFRNVVHWGGV